MQQQAHSQGQNAEALAHLLVRAGLGISSDAEITEAKQAELIQRLQAAGLLTELPTRPLGPPPRLITVIGPPVSQTIIEDRE